MIEHANTVHAREIRILYSFKYSWILRLSELDSDGIGCSVRIKAERSYAPSHERRSMYILAYCVETVEFLQLDTGGFEKETDAASPLSRKSGS